MRTLIVASSLIALPLLAAASRPMWSAPANPEAVRVQPAAAGELTVDPVHSRARALLIQTLQKLNRTTDAIALAKETVTILPRDREALELLKNLTSEEN